MLLELRPVSLRDIDEELVDAKAEETGGLAEALSKDQSPGDLETLGLEAYLV